METTSSGTYQRVNDAAEYTAGNGSSDVPTIDGDWIRNLLVMGLKSKNAWNATSGNAGDVAGPRRDYSKVCATESEYSKLDGLESFILHKTRQPAADKLGTFHNPRSTDKGLRMDMLCIKTNEQYHPQVIALRDNVERKRPFGGFSVNSDIEVDRVTGVVEHLLEAKSIDLVPQPATVKSAIEGDVGDGVDIGKDLTELKHAHEELESKHEALREEHETLKADHAEHAERLSAVECYIKARESEAPRADDSKTTVAASEGVSEGAALTAIPVVKTDAKQGRGGRTEPIPGVSSKPVQVTNPFLLK